MQCTTCHGTLDPGGVFPGGTLVCACGTSNVVPRMTREVTAPNAASAAPSTRGPAANDLRQARGATAGHLRCPRCHKPLTRATAHGEPVDVCAHCEGAFIVHEALARVVEAADARDDATNAAAPRAGERDVRYVSCPRCGETMTRMNFGRRSGIIVDACRAHGTWFDRGELDAVVAFVARGGLAADAHAAMVAPNDEVAQMTRAAEALLTEEMRRDAANVKATTDLVDDLVFVLFPGNRSLVWRTRR